MARRFPHAAARGEEVKAEPPRQGGGGGEEEGRGCSPAAVVLVDEVGAGAAAGPTGGRRRPRRFRPRRMGPMPFISRNVIQDEVRLGVAVCDSAVKSSPPPPPPPPPPPDSRRVTSRPLRGSWLGSWANGSGVPGALPPDGFVLVFLELAKFPVLRPLSAASTFRVPGAHLPQRARRRTSPKPARTSRGDGRASAELGPNQKRSNVNIYAAPIHDFKLLLRALTEVLRTDDGGAASTATTPPSGSGGGGGGGNDDDDDDDEGNSWRCRSCRGAC